MPPMHFPEFFYIELIYTLIVVIFCAVIHYKTKESYDLTKYEGLKYFRSAFLFFGLAYLLRFIFSLLLFSTIAFDFIVPRRMFAPIFILPLGYFSTVAIFYLIFSLVWDKFKPHLIRYGHIIAIVLAVISFVPKSHVILLLLQSLLLIGLILLVFMRQGKKVSAVKILYFLIALSWLINLWIISPRRIFSFDTNLMLQLISIIAFVMIYYKLHKWIK